MLETITDLGHQITSPPSWHGAEENKKDKNKYKLYHCLEYIFLQTEYCMAITNAHVFVQCFELWGWCFTYFYYYYYVYVN